MKVVHFSEYGGPEQLVLTELPNPRLECTHNSALIRVRACGVNHLDIDIRKGASRYALSLPHILGLEIVGEVVELSEDSKVQLTKGDHVMVLYKIPCGQCVFCRTGRENLCQQSIRPGVTIPGGYAEYVVVPNSGLVRLPDNLGWQLAAAIQLAFGTAWHMLITQGGLKAGETVMINAAGSGIGSAAIQVARMAGATIIATAGSDDKIEKALQLGANVGINYERQDMVRETMRHTKGQGVDLVFEHVGGILFEKSLACLVPDGRIVLCGAHSGEIVSLDLIQIFRRQTRIIGSRGATTMEQTRVLDLVAKGVLRPIVHNAFPLGQARQAHEMLERREHFGKIVIVP